jgi:hypothetical protein
MDIKNQMDTTVTTSPTVMGITIPWFITVLLVDMMGMSMLTLAYRTIAIPTHTIQVQLLTIITITILFHTQTQMLQRTTQEAQEAQKA